jgi:hypothetical protein
MTDLQIYRYLRFKQKFVRGRVLCRSLGIRANRLEALNYAPGIGSMGPVTSKPLSPERYAKYNAFCADFIAFFCFDGKYRCRKGTSWRPGCQIKRYRPKRHV